jgi:RNA polymerase sigma-70 factor (ECF subfamily)
MAVLDGAALEAPRDEKGVPALARRGRASTARRGGSADIRSAFDAHYPEVWRLAHRIVGRAEDADDVAQDAFLRLHDRRVRGLDERDTRAWLLRVTSNLSLNALRARGRRARRLQRAGGEEWLAGSDPGDPPARAVDRRAEIERVRTVLAGLGERDAALLLLRHGGASYAELAETFGVAPGSVGTLLARAESAFEAAYAPSDPDHGGRQEP